jgi:hypothetical protein
MQGRAQGSLRTAKSETGCYQLMCHLLVMSPRLLLMLNHSWHFQALRHTLTYPPLHLIPINLSIHSKLDIHRLIQALTYEGL